MHLASVILASHTLHGCGLLLQIPHVAWYVCLSICLCVGHTDVPGKTTELIEMSFGGRLGWAQGTIY